MVGVPRSNGCLLCVRRRVRCDETRPGCGNCAKYGADCPGYDRSLKFVAGKHQVRQRQRRKPDDQASSAAGCGSDPPLARRGDDDDGASGTGAGAGSGSGFGSSSEPVSTASLIVSPSRATDTALTVTIPAAPPVDRAAFVNAMIENLYLDRMQEDTAFYGTWFARHVPSSLGRKVTLDSATCALAMQMLGRSRGDAALLNESRQVYGQALAALQRAISHPVEWRSSETLCSSMVLGMYELFADTSGKASWMQHALGVAWLIQQRGPDGYADEWDRSMFFSFRGIIVMQSLFTLQDCFLAKTKWQGVMRNRAVEDDDDSRRAAAAEEGSTAPGSTPAALLEPNLLRVLDEYLVHLARVPGVLRFGYALRMARLHGMPVDPTQVALARRRGGRLREAFLDWYERRFLPSRLGELTEVPSEDPSSPYATVLRFGGNSWLGAVHIGYWTSMLIVQECLNQCEDGGSGSDGSSDGDGVQRQQPRYAESNRALARNIYRSFEHVMRGVMGPYRVGYAMRISYNFADVPTQRWIRSLLGRMEKTYASARVDTYPDPAPNEYGYN